MTKGYRRYRFIRHAHAPKKDGLPDKDRTPSKVGYAQIEALRQSLEKEKPTFAAVFHSGVVRTETPARVVSEQLGCPIEEMPILFNPKEGSVERVVLDWAVEKHGGNYGYNIPRYLADSIVRLALEKYVTEAVHRIRTATEAARTSESGVEVAFICHAVYIQLFCQALLASDHKVKTPKGDVDLVDLDLNEGDQLLVTIHDNGSEEIEYTPLKETTELKEAKEQMAAAIE